MKSTPIRTVLVAGTGSIGAGVVRSCADSGYDTAVLTRDPARVTRQFAGVRALAELPVEAPDLVIECLPEVADIKLAFYAKVEDAYQGHSILATNTSGLPIDELAAGLKYRDRFLGMHYLFPAHMPGLFVEVIRTSDTSDDVVDRVLAMMAVCRKHPIILNRPVVGGLFNRLQHAILREAYFMVEQGIASADQIDDMARQFIAPRMCITGLLQQKDLSGLDTHTLAHEAILPHLCNRTTVSPVLKDRHDRGDLGLKTGKGFYDWRGADPDRTKTELNAKAERIKQLMAQMAQESVSAAPGTGGSVECKGKGQS